MSVLVCAFLLHQHQNRSAMRRALAEVKENSINGKAAPPSPCSRAPSLLELQLLKPPRANGQPAWTKNSNIAGEQSVCLLKKYYYKFQASDMTDAILDLTCPCPLLLQTWMCCRWMQVPPPAAHRPKRVAGDHGEAVVVQTRAVAATGQANPEPPPLPKTI